MARAAAKIVSNMLRGAGSALTLMPEQRTSRALRRIAPKGQRGVGQALGRDWEAVGGDFRRAIQAYERSRG